LWIPPDDGNDYYAEITKPIITIEQDLRLKEPSEERVISNFIQNIYPSIVEIRECNKKTEGEGMSSNINAKNNNFNDLSAISIDDNTPQYLDEYFVEESLNHQVKTIDISIGTYLNIKNQVQPFQQQELHKLLQKYSTMFAWDYKDICMGLIHIFVSIIFIFNME
jgi:hypothetical protein